MEKHNSEIKVTKNFLKSNPYIIYVLPCTMRSGAIPNIRFSQFNNLENVLKFPIIDDVSSPNKIEYCCDHHQCSIPDSGFGMVNSAIDSIINAVKNKQNYQFYIEDISRLQYNSGNVCLDCCEIECFLKDKLEKDLEDANNVIFLWPKRS